MLFMQLVIIVILALLLHFVWRVRLRLIRRYQSPLLGRIDVYQKYNGEKILMINKYAQGISTEQPSIKQSYWYNIATQVITHCKKRKHPQILFLGLGANTSSSLVNDMAPHISQTLLEIDQNIIRACREHFSLEKMKNTEIVHEDAYRAINTKREWQGKFDVIVIDIFTGKPPFLSSDTNKPPFIQKLLVWLKDDGMFLFNRPANVKGVDTKELLIYLQTLFTNVTLVEIRDPRGYRNHVITATLPLKKNRRMLHNGIK
jgi:spermidine synthase